MKKLVLCFLVLFCALGLLFAEGGADKAKAPEEVLWAKNVEIQVPATAGGLADLNARTLSNYISAASGSNLTVINNTDGGGAVAIEKVYNAKADGSILLSYHLTMMIKSAAGVFKRKPTEDYTVIAVADPVPPGGYFLLVNSDSDIKSLDDLIAKAKANPGKLLYGVEMGGSSHVMGGTLAKAAGIEFKFVESGADTEKLTALVGKTLDVISCNPNQARQYVQAERARALACFSKSDGKRSEILPEVPTFMELGLDFSFDGPQFILGPKNMDPALARKIHAYYEAAAKDEGVNKVLQPAGQEIRILSFEEGPEKLKRMQAEFDTMVEELGIKRR